MGNNVDELEGTPQVPMTPVIPLEQRPGVFENGKLTRYGMEQVIKDGGSVMIGGASISRIENLPTEAQLAGADDFKRAQARANLEARQAQLQREFEQLDAPVDPHPSQRDTPFVDHVNLPGVSVGTLGDGSGDLAGAFPLTVEERAAILEARRKTEVEDAEKAETEKKRQQAQAALEAKAAQAAAEKAQKEAEAEAKKAAENK